MAVVAVVAMAVVRPGSSHVLLRQEHCEIKVLGPMYGEHRSSHLQLPLTDTWYCPGHVPSSTTPQSDQFIAYALAQNIMQANRIAFGGGMQW